MKYGKKKGKAYKRGDMMSFYLNAHPCCEICGASPVDGHHIISRATGGVEEEWNYLALCRVDHAVFHMMGRYSFAQRYPQFEEKIKTACENMGRVFNKGG
jgi:5-methylcytosine-specific restriction endonuclease McrA